MIGQDGGEFSERTLWTQFRLSGCSDDRAGLLRLYEPFAKSIAARMYGMRGDSSVSFDDYLQYARVGLIEAVDRFDFSREVTFSTFAASRVRGAILNGVAKESEVAAQNRFWRGRIRERIDSLCTASAPSADRASLAQIATITMGLALGVLLDETRDEFEPADHNARNNPYHANELRQLSDAIKQLVERLSDRERSVIVGHYVEQLEFRQIAERLNITKGRVSQLHAQALQRLKSWLDERPQVDNKL